MLPCPAYLLIAGYLSIWFCSADSREKKELLAKDPYHVTAAHTLPQAKNHEVLREWEVEQRVRRSQAYRLYNLCHDLSHGGEALHEDV